MINRGRNRRINLNLDFAEFPLRRDEIPEIAHLKKAATSNPIRSPWHPLRMATRVQTDFEVSGVSDVGPIEVIRPTRDDLDAMGSNMLDGRRRAAVALQAYTTAVATLT